MVEFKSKLGSLVKTINIIKIFSLSRILFLGLLILLAVIIDLFSITLVIPVLTVLQSKSFLNTFFENNEYIDNLSQTEEIYLIVFLMCFVFLFKFFFLLVLNYNQNKYTSFLQSSISEKLMKQYILMPYKNYFKRNTSELLRNIKDESGSFVYGVIAPLLNLLIEILVVVGILLILFYQLSLNSFLILALIITFLIIYVNLTKKLINKLGKERFRFDENIIKKSNEIFQSIRDIKIYFLEQKFLRDYTKVLTNYADSMKKFLTMQNLPRLTIELTLVIILSLIIVLFAIEDINFEEASIKLGLFAAAAFRLLPSINKIISAQQILRFHNPSVNEIYKEIKNDLEYDIFKFKNKINFSKKILLKNLSFSYLPKKKILNNLNLKINAGDRIGIIGTTGSGKSTLIDILSGLITDYEGSISIDNKLINFDRSAWANNIGYVSQDSLILNSSIISNIVFSKNIEKNPKKKIFKILKEVELYDYVKNLKNSISSIIGERGIDLSGGQKQKINIARALYKNPQLLILDEAFSALDIHTERKILENIRMKYKHLTLINISHKGESLKLCNKVYQMNNGKLKKIK